MNFNIALHKKDQYRYSVIIIAVLLVAGLLLQYFTGPIAKQWFAFPNNIWIGIAFIFLFTTLFLLFKQKEFINLLSSVPLALVSTIILGVLTIGLGSIHIEASDPKANPVLLRLGFDGITTTWYFAFIFFLVLINLWLAILKKALVFQTKNITFLLNHFGLWLTLFAGVLGQGDLTRLTMNLKQDQPEWRATDENGRVTELSLALELKKFDIDIYPNKLYIINKEGKALPQNKPQAFMLEKEHSSQYLLNWKITLHEYLPNAIPVSDTTYAASPMWGATNAARITVEDVYTKAKRTQWIAAGNFQFPPLTITLDSNHIVVMGPAEARKFQSKVLVYEKGKDEIREETIQVNHPITIKGWKVYQVSYDERLGRWSELSVVELILDPWLPLVYTGIFILIAGTAAFLFKNRK